MSHQIMYRNQVGSRVKGDSASGLAANDLYRLEGATLQRGSAWCRSRCPRVVVPSRPHHQAWQSLSAYALHAGRPRYSTQASELGEA